MKRQVRDKVVIVTGSSRGLGRAVALACAHRGARVAIAARSRESLERLAAEIADTPGQARVCPTDLRDSRSIEATVQEVRAAWGRIDVLINAAGCKVEGPVETVDADAVREAVEVNYIGPLAMCQAVLPAMREQHCGHILNVSSVLGKRATPLRGAYSASKAALNALTDALRVEVRRCGIDVTLVCPGRLAEPADAGASRWAMSTARAAERIVQCVENPRRELMLTSAGRCLSRLNAWAPWLVDRILGQVRHANV